MSAIYTIGHSSHPLETFLDLLQQQNIETLVDVRSQPYSRWNPQFNRENLAAALQNAGMRYVDLGSSLGGRPDQPDLYNPGSERPDYERQAQTAVYQQGVAQLVQLAQNGRITIMCSEGDPDVCHRTLLITPTLLQLGHTVQHILSDGRLKQAEMPAKQLRLL